MKIVACGLHGFHEVLGIDEDEVYFHWTVESDDSDAVQSAYQITVRAEDANDGPIVWSSGRIASPKHRDIRCRPDGGFTSASPYYWRVAIWNQKDERFQSTPNFFFTAYPRSTTLPPWSPNHEYMPHSSLIFRTWFENPLDRWKAVWIGDGGDKPIYLRHQFDLEEQPVRAIMFATGLGHFNLTVNGTRASDHVLDPGWTNYHRSVQFVSFDILQHLTVGANVLGAHVGNGFYAGDQGDRFFWPMYEDRTYVRYGNELCFFGELHLFYEDGRRQVITSGPEWRVHKSSTTLANIYGSETHDRRSYPTGWDTPAFDASAWSPAKPVMGPRGVLRYQSQPPLTLQEAMIPKSSRTIRPGLLVFDLGQNCSTMVKVTLRAKAASEVVIRCAETISEEGTVLMPDPLFKEFETGVYNKITLAGTTNAETWEPEFSFTSARYVQIEGASLDGQDQLPQVVAVLGQHVSSAARRLGNLKTDKEDVNQLIDMCYWSFVSNLFSYHTDCPQIEKFGWLEVTHLLFPATQYIRDIESLHSKILQDILDAQEPSGFVPNMAPEIRYMSGPLRETITWSAALCLIPELLKRYYGSTRMMAKVYPAAVNYVAYMKKKERKGGLIEHGLGDWGRDIAFGNSQANIETAVYYRCLRCCELMARELDHASDANYYQSEAARILGVYNDMLLMEGDSERPYHFYTSLDTPGVQDCTAVNQAVALQSGMVPAEHVADVHASFLQAVSHGRLEAGEIGLQPLFLTLKDLARPDIVLKMARQEEHPSYMRFIRRGETTLSEFWQDNCRSKCHDMFGTIYEWLYVGVLGVETKDAYENFTVSPPYGSEFCAVNGSVACPHGTITVSYSRQTIEDISIGLTIPFGTNCRLQLPSYSHSLEVSQGSRQIQANVEQGSINLKQGKYHVRLTRTSI